MNKQKVPTKAELCEILSLAESCIRLTSRAISGTPPGDYRRWLCKHLMFLVHYRNQTLNMEGV